MKDKLKTLRKKRSRIWDMSGSVSGKSIRILPSLSEIAKTKGYHVIYIDTEQSIDIEKYREYLNGYFRNRNSI